MVDVIFKSLNSKISLLTDSPDGMACGLDWFHDSLVEERHQLPLAHALKCDVRVNIKSIEEEVARYHSISISEYVLLDLLVRVKFQLQKRDCMLRNSTYVQCVSDHINVNAHN